MKQCSRAPYSGPTSSSPISRCPTKTEYGSPNSSGCGTQDLPIIAVTGHAEVFRPRLEAVFFRQVLLKPVDPWQFAEAILAVVH